MSKFSYSNIPKISFLSRESIEEIVNISFQLLEKIGIEVKFRDALDLLRKAGCEIDEKRSRVKICSDLVKEAVKSAPSSIKIYSRDGKHDIVLEGDNVYFRPGSAAIFILDSETMEIRDLLLKDSKDLVTVVDYLGNIQIQSGQIPKDVPELISDRFRLYIPLKYSVKPVFAAPLTFEGIHDMKKMLDIVVEDVSKRPIAIFGVCPSPPLKWSSLSISNLIDCARYNIPCELISMPQLAATGPSTIVGCIAQHTAETLSGIVISQLANKGAPVIYGGSPTAFDLKYGTACLGAPEVTLMVMGYVEIGKYLGLPTHGYLGLSDSKVVDNQAGFETGIGILIGVLKGINVISGPGMLYFETTQSLEKLVLDNEICGYAYRVARGASISEEISPLEIFEEAVNRGVFISLKHTLKWFRKELYFPSEVIDRKPLKLLLREKGKTNSLDRARETVNRILKEHKPEPLPLDVEKDLNKFINTIAKKHGMKEVPV